ncbi:MAG: thermonuclease family protein [Desulfobacterales bacterium]|nr:thermonuclease family protein [Desulfobacterales bacterium]MCP4162938.1 thermonuclease family protein [Deltaproteobacteria bacterium]
MKKILFVLLLSAFILPGCLKIKALNYYNKTFTEKIIDVIDAQTFVTVNSRKNKNKIILYGIVAPKTYSATGKNAKKMISELIKGKKIRFTVKGIDDKNKLISIAWLEDEKKSLNVLLLEKGYAKVYSDKCKLPECKEWIKAEQKARQQKLGMFK